jgi:hypothetical protein
MDWWDKWARRDPDYSPAPYAQLAAALTSVGDRDGANKIGYLGPRAGMQDRREIGPCLELGTLPFWG